MHSFEEELAKLHGVNVALVFESIAFWWKISTKDKRKFMDGHAWSYHTYHEFETVYPYLSRMTIRRAVKTLEDNGYILTANYNHRANDATKWYTLTEKGEKLYEIRSKSASDTPVQIEHTPVQNEQPPVQIEHTPVQNDTALPVTNYIYSDTVTNDRMEEKEERAREAEDNPFGDPSEWSDERPDLSSATAYAMANLLFMNLPSNMALFMEYSKRFPDDLVRHAVDLTAQHAGGRFSYFISIMQRATEEGYSTLNQMLAAEEAFKLRKAGIAPKPTESASTSETDSSDPYKEMRDFYG